GDHFDTGDNEHGKADSDDSHAGDLGNLTVKDDGTIDFKITTRKVTLQPGEKNSLDNPNGTSIVIHADEDDQSTQPSGNSGAREACGIIFRSHEPVTHYMPGYEGLPASEEATPGATPAS
ncbi:MAG TPA: superoxide dismutase family protein, partial [Thermomicrobiales bacterium]|nr:superoxide dismutase family protein [Thermomicrobiales bacterium]